MRALPALVAALLGGAGLLVAAAPAQAATTVARDGFTRSVTGGLGAADAGGAWTLSGTASDFAVAGGAARLSAGAGVTRSAYLGSLALTDVDAAATFATTAAPSGGGVYETVVVRRRSGADYGARLVLNASGAVSIGVFRDGTHLRSATPAWTASPGTAVRVRVQATGTNPTVLRARAWRADATEPTTWAVTTSDTTAALQGPGAVGLRSHLSATATAAPLTSTADDLVVTDLAASANRPPVAAFTTSANGQTVAFDGSSSADPEGPVASWAWSFGDGTTGTGSRTSHSYATPGTYPVTLTVRDQAGLSAATTTSLAVSAGTRPTQAQWLADVSAALDGATAYVDSQQGVSRPALVLDIDNTALQSYYQPFAATPATFDVAKRAEQDGYAVLFATGRSADTGGTLSQLTRAGYRVDGLCFRDPAAASIEASKIACRAAWTAQGFTVVANVGNHATDLNGASSGRTYLLPSYGFLD
ncbi:PKD domain-containing protein [Microlunatus flavus]|uniref:HAD superfamily, subfamily IIIB (Acid phosphatase) n=1 Tax=Microlunatus flavus TaxID=1036181 RepID=A0A1H9GVZ9_9ACTN|nr:PKD domain-containing protein [Microlunatus flavus]SEQ54219.1 HAD superfamily, subfamily IIIB (Acid phosphatase) [Microlunatus flavus]